MNEKSTVLEGEIEAQPDAVADFLSREAERTRRLVATLPPFSYIVMVGRGSSDHAALYAHYLWEYATGTPVAISTPSLHTIYRHPSRLDGALVVAVSQSGQSSDVVAVVEEANRQARPTIAITNDLSSSLARSVDHVMDLGIIEESVAATGSYTCELAAIALLAAVWSESQERIEALRRVPSAMRKTLELSRGPVREAAGQFLDARTLLTIARGFNFPTAHQMAHKLRELLRIHSFPFSAADFRPGPGSNVLVEADLPVALIMPSGAAFDDMLVLSRTLKAGGARVIVISDNERAQKDASVFLPLAPEVPEWLSPLTAVLPAQRFALELSLRRGLDLDRRRAQPRTLG